MENKNEKSTILEELLSEILRDTKVIDNTVKEEEGLKEQKKGESIPMCKSSTPFFSINIKNLHLHMDERITYYNYEFGQKLDSEARRTVDKIDWDEILEHIHKKTGLHEQTILPILPILITLIVKLVVTLFIYS